MRTVFGASIDKTDKTTKKFETQNEVHLIEACDEISPSRDAGCQYLLDVHNRQATRKPRRSRQVNFEVKPMLLDFALQNL